MAAAELKPEVTCTICMDIFTDPVTLICGHSFCKICITRTFDNQHDREYFCPECLHDFNRRPELKKNPRLSNIADHIHSVEPKRHKPEHVCSYCVKLHVPAVTLCLHCEAFLCDVHKQAHSKSPEHVLTDPTTSLEDRKCPVHKKVLEYYCIDDGTCICVYCLASDHNGHRLSTISEYFQQKTKNLEPILDKLSTKRVETEKKLQSLQDHKRKIDNKADGVADRVTSIMRDIRRKHDNLEKRVRAEISSQQQQISLSVSNDIQQLEREKTELNKKITQIEELSRSTNPISALQTPEMLLCVSEDEYDLDREVASAMIRKGGDLKEDVIFETLHSGLSNIVEGAGTNVYVKDVQKVSLSAADDNIHIGSSSVSNKLQVEVPVFTYGPIAPVWSHAPLKTQVQAITTKPQNVLLNAGGCQNIPLVAAKPLRVPTVEAEPQNIPAIAAEPQNLPFSAAESQNISLIEAEPQNIHLVAAEPQNVPLVAAEPQNIPLVEAKPLRVPTIEAEPQNIPAIAAEPQNLPFSAAESQNISLIEAEPQNIQLVAAESQNIPLVAAEPQNVPLIAAEPQNSSLIEAEPQNIPLVAAEPQNVPLVAEPQNAPLIAAEPQNIPLVAAKPLRVPTVEAEPQNIPAISAEPQNLPLSAAESQNISVMEAEPQNIPLVAAESENIPLVAAEPQNVPLILGNSSTTQEILLGVNTASNYLLTYDNMDDDTNDDTENDTESDIADYLKNSDDDDSKNDFDDEYENYIDDDSENDFDDEYENDIDDEYENDIDYEQTDKDTEDDLENDNDDDFGC